MRSRRPLHAAPTEVVFDRICRHNGIEHLLTKIRCSCSAGAGVTGGTGAAVAAAAVNALLYLSSAQ